MALLNVIIIDIVLVSRPFVKPIHISFPTDLLNNYCIPVRVAFINLKYDTLNVFFLPAFLAETALYVLRMFTKAHLYCNEHHWSQLHVNTKFSIHKNIFSLNISQKYV